MEQETNFGKLLKRYRKYYDYTQAETAIKLGYSKETIRSWEQGRRFPTREEVARLAQLLELDAQEVKRSIQIGRSQTARKEYETNQLVPGIFIEEAILDDATRFGLIQAQLIALVNQWNTSTTIYYELQQVIHRGISMFDELKQQTSEGTYTFSRRQAIASIAMLPVSLVHSLQLFQQPTLVPEELLPQCAASITACWHLMKGSQLALIEQVLSSYLPTLKGLAQQPSRYQKAAAGLASQGSMLCAILALHRLDFASRTKYCNDAVKYSHIAQDNILQAAALMYLGYNYGYINQPEKSLVPFQMALRSLGETHSLLKNDVYMGMADAYARCGQESEAQFTIGLAENDFPTYPENDPSFLFADCGLSALYIWEGRTFIDLSEYYPEHGHPKKAWEALANIKRVQPASDRNRTEILIYQAKAAFRLEDLELCCACLEDGVKAASALNSRRRFSEAYEVYQLVTLKWSTEQRVKALQEVFTTFKVI